MVRIVGESGRTVLIASIERWFQQERDERIGNIAASALLGYFVQEIGPSIYNLAVADVQERLGQRVAAVDVELHLVEPLFRRHHLREHFGIVVLERAVGHIDHRPREIPHLDDPPAQVRHFIPKLLHNGIPAAASGEQ